MKTLWTILSVLAVANLLALAGFVGWLHNTDRLDTGRMRQIREVLTKTVSQQKTETEAKAQAQEAERIKAQAEKRASQPPLTAAERLSARVEATELDRQRIERLKREVLDLQRQLSEERRVLEAQKLAFEAEKRGFDEAIASSNAAGTDAQFQKTLKVLQGQKPTQAVALLREMLAEPVVAPPEFASVPMTNGATAAPTSAAAAASEKRMATVVGYLDAMNDKSRAKIIEALTKTDPKLAAELLERLRQRGEFARVP
jgi:hypothetical protein